MDTDHRSLAPGPLPADLKQTVFTGSRPAAMAMFPLDLDCPHGGTALPPRVRHAVPRPGRRRGRMVLAGVVAVGAAVGTVAVASGAESATLIATDDFGRTVATGWGTAAVGGGWSATAPLTGLAVRSQGASVTLPAERSGRSVWLSGVSATDVSARTDVTFLATPAGNGQIAAITLRKNARQQEYRVRMRLAADRSLRVSFSKIVNGRPERTLGAETVVASQVAQGVPVTLAAAVSGTEKPTLAAAAWPATSGAPDGWAAKYTDGTDPVASAGTLGVWFYSGGGQQGATPLLVTGLRAVDKVGSAPIGDGMPRPVPTLPTLSPVPSAPPSSAPAPGPTNPGPTSTSTAPGPGAPVGDRPGAGAGAPALGSTKYATPAEALVVSPSGNDDATGNSASPYRTIAQAVRAASSGDTIALRGGTYHESVQVPSNKRLTIQNWPGEAVWLDGSAVVSSWTQDGATWRHDGWTAQFDSSVPASSSADFQMIDPKYPLASHPDQVFVNGEALTQVGSEAAVTAGTFYVDYGSRQLYLGSSPIGKEVRASDIAEAIYLNRSTGSTVRGIGIRRYATPYERYGTVKAFGDNTTLADLHIEDTATVAIGVQGSNVKIIDNTIERAGQLGMNAHQSDGLTVSGNLVRDNNTEHFKAIPVAGGMKMTSCRNITISGNSVIGNGSTGIWMDESVWNATVVNNDVRANTHHGIYFELSAQALIANNTVVDNGDSGIRVADSAHARIWNNTVLRNSIGVDIQDGPRVATNLSTPGHDKRRPLPDPDMTWVVSDLQLRSNVLDVGSRGGTPYLFRADDGTNARTAEQMKVTADYDLYLRPSPSALGTVVAWSNRPSGVRSFASAAAFTSGTGQEAHGQGLDVATTAALNSAAAGGDLGLRSSNPAKGKGAPLPADVAAVVGHAAGGAPDPGAFFG